MYSSEAQRARINGNVKRYYQKHKVEIAARRKEKYEQKKASPETWKAYRERRNELKRKNRLQWKLECFEAYGGRKCNHCGHPDVRVLQLDHIEGGGRRQREKHGGGFYLYRYLKKLGYPSGYQVLCANCNWIKKHERGEGQGPVLHNDIRPA